MVTDTTSAWAASYRGPGPGGVRSQGVTARVVLHLERFVEYFTATYGHDRPPVVPRDVFGWRDLSPRE